MRGICTTLGVLLLACACASAQEQRPGAIIEDLIGLDANGDRVVEKSEVPESGQAAFDRLLRRGDQNANGKLELEELRGLLGRLRGAGASPSRRIAAMDADGDGFVSRDEYRGPEAAFDHLDADKDGKISRDEAAAQPGRAAIPAAARAGRLKAMDKDGDGRITRAEFSGPEALFGRLDADKDGVITGEEIENAPPPRGPRPSGPPPGRPAPGEGPGSALGRLRELDKDGDGKVSKQEFREGLADALFDRLDTDGDGFLTPEERRAAARRPFPILGRPAASPRRAPEP